MDASDLMPTKQFPDVENRNHLALLVGEGAQVALRYYEAAWQFNRWDGNGWITPKNQTYFDCVIPVRGVYIFNVDEQKAVLKYDLLGYTIDKPEGWNDGATYLTGVTSPLICGMQYSKRIRRVYLGVETTATEIFLSA
ncbi:MAG: hypothetical protein WC898_02315 [Candidatus Paceibacterota bacterium]|jgi:hypothetical protein